MRFNTALTLLLLGGSLWLMKNEETSPLQKHLGRALAGLVLLLSLLTSSQFSIAWLKYLPLMLYFVKNR